MNWTTTQRAPKARGRLGVPLPVLACHYRERDKSRRSGPKQMVRELLGRPRPLAPRLRPQFGLAFIGSDRLARFSDLFHWRLRSAWDRRAPSAGGLRLCGQARYRQLAIILKVVLRLVPTTENAAMAATAIRAAIKAYSIAVTPLVSPISRSIARPSPLSSTWFSNVVSFIFW
jgi:hypothetical protein